MAVTLNIPLTDAEQATVSAWLDTLKPGMTNAEKKALLERHGRRLLRDDLLRRLREHRAAEDREAELARRRAEADDVASEDVFAPEVEG